MRDASSAYIAALSATNVPMVLFVELQPYTGTTRFCSAPYDIDWNGSTWVGLGNLGSIDPIQETGTLEVTGLTMTLSGMNTAFLAEAFNEQIQGQAAIVYVALLDETYAVLADPIQEFRGRIDTMQIVDTGASGSVTLTVENRLADFKRTNVRRFNSEDQNAYYPADRFFDFVPDMVEKSVVWPNKEFFKQ